MNSSLLSISNQHLNSFYFFSSTHDQVPPPPQSKQAHTPLQHILLAGSGLHSCPVWMQLLELEFFTAEMRKFYIFALWPTHIFILQLDELH